MTIFEYENEGRQFIKKIVDGNWDGGYVHLSQLDDPEFSDYAFAHRGGFVQDPSVSTEELEGQAKVSRDEAIDAPIEVHGVLWDIDSTSRDRMLTAIRAAGRNPARSTVNWVLADNSIRETTAEELEQVLDAYALRMEETFVAHTMWRMGDKKTKFKL